MSKISAVVITLNEERNIKRCIQSLDGVADEVIVVDSHSTDQTVDIAESCGATVYQIDWAGYSLTKNFGHSKANYEYILSIDADEALSEELKSAILKVKKESLHGTYSFNRLTNYCGKWIKHGGWYPDEKLRLFPTKSSIWEGDIHEKLVFHPSQKNTKLKGDLLHYSYYTFEEHQTRADKYSSLTAIKMHENGKTASVFKPFISAFSRFFGMYIIEGGILDGKMGLIIAYISAKSNFFKYQELKRLNSSK